MSHNLLKGKRGIIFGALNDMSIAWKVAEKAVEEGATITLSNTPIAVRMGQVDALAEKLHAEVIPADATSVEDLETVFSKSVEILGGKIDFVLHSIGYSRMSYVKRDSRIAIIPIGYADGLDRHFSNGGGEVVINGHRCPIIGNICMDACMIDVTDTDAHEGDSVIIFGEELPVSELSDKLKTIPYEILTSISPRVKRVYYRE